MRLTKHTDYSLRVLIYVGSWPERWVSTEEIAKSYGISNHHLVKVVNKLGKEGYLEVKRGRLGGIRLAVEPKEIRLGTLVRKTEPDFCMAECFDSANNTCPITSVCALIRPLHEAKEAFLGSLDRFTLADVVGPRHLVKLRTVFSEIADVPSS